jgi:hypothetical protein
VPLHLTVSGKILVTLAVAAVFVCATFLWRSVETWRAGKRTGAFVSLVAAAVEAIALAAFVYGLGITDSPWAWIGLPMACRYTLRGC